MTLVYPYVVCEKNTHAMNLAMVCEKNTHAMTLAVVHEKNRHVMTHKYRGCIAVFLKEVKPNLLIRHTGSQIIFISLNN